MGPDFESDATLSEDSSANAAPRATETNKAPAWEEIRAGRYRPRRIKGSCKARALG